MSEQIFQNSNKTMAAPPYAPMAYPPSTGQPYPPSTGQPYYPAQPYPPSTSQPTVIMMNNVVQAPPTIINNNNNNNNNNNMSPDTVVVVQGKKSMSKNSQFICCLLGCCGVWFYGIPGLLCWSVGWCGLCQHLPFDQRIFSWINIILSIIVGLPILVFAIVITISIIVGSV